VLKPKTTLVDGEDVLWASYSGREVSVGNRLPANIRLMWIVGLLASVFFSFYLSNVIGFGYNHAILYFWAIIVFVSVLNLIIGHFRKNGTTQDKIIESYFITSKRLIVEDKAGTFRKIFSGRAFNSLDIREEGSKTSIYLAGYYLQQYDPDHPDAYVGLIHIDEPELAEQLLMQYHMRGMNS
jgi:hypothetical protein